MSRGTIATIIGGAIIAGLPMLLAEVIKNGYLRPEAALTIATFLALVAGAFLQWWVSHGKNR